MTTYEKRDLLLKLFVALAVTPVAIHYALELLVVGLRVYQLFTAAPVVEIPDFGQ